MGEQMHDPFDLDELIALKMMEILKEHGWDFTYSRDPVLILIELEEQDGETDNS